MKDNELIAIAKEATNFSYAPYSNFKVGAALECKDGEVFIGCNIENAAFGLTMCAERVAIFKAVSAGQCEFSRIAVYADDVNFCMPCGSCRQVMSEFSNGEMEVLCAKGNMSYKSYKLRELLPHVFKLEDR